MLQFITFAIIYGIMMYIWTFVYLNQSTDKVNQSFLSFLSVVLIWMVLSMCNNYASNSLLGLTIKTIYWYSMLNMALFFLLFVYRLTQKALDPLFYVVVILNELAILSRYLFPIDYSDPTFWRLTDPIVAPIMSAVFSFPALYGLFLLIKQFRVVKDLRQKKQLRYIYIGISIGLILSVISEYALPTLFNLDTHYTLMYFAVLIFVVFTFVSIMKHSLLNLRSEYIYRKLLLNAQDGVAIINKKNRIICINDIAKAIFKDASIDLGDKITDHINEYDFRTNYKQHEVVIKTDGREDYLTITQYPIDTADQDSAKLLMMTDITTAKLKIKQEKELLIAKSSIDHLTGLYNKQYFDDVYYGGTPELAGEKLVVLFIDVDDFKTINDLNGHVIGDQVLKSVARCIKDCIGSNAQAVRFGGDEFVIVFKNIMANEAYLVAEEIRNKVSKLDFSQSDDTLKISLSVGLAEGLMTVEDLILKADEAMYRSKNNGKNMTTMFTDFGIESSYPIGRG